MQKSATRRSDVLEYEWSQSIGLLGGGLLLVVIAGLILYFAGFITHSPALIWVVYLVGALILLAGASLCLVAIKRGVFAPRIPTVPFNCPYCDAQTMFLEPPTTDYTCDHCDRQVHFENGVLVPVRHIVCPACRAEHRVAINVQRFVCDRCNRALHITPDKPIKLADTEEPGNGPQKQRTFDVMFVAYDHRRENEVAFKVQNLLVVNMKEARRLMQHASSSTPLIVAQNEPELKAESIRRQLQELGATATLRPTSEGRPTARGGAR